MIGIDTNVLVRYLTQDHQRQGEMAKAVFATLTPDVPGYLSREVMIELVWVLERAYGLPRYDICEAIDGLLASRELVVETPDRVGLANERYRKGGAGFSDHMIALAARDAGCHMTLSFDRKAVSSAGMTEVREATA
ncbi:PIN domain-containing protein [Paracoccus aestuariivivens]|uniref:PIN domain-containing protein n=1 Tax=Paracoccus aestuariivivens TaxID=1820333 RepID=A0A6L6J7F0_9RHOB|nr:type II toxin-antitoxin system VapC family toxin [Paracoccus aestuariivivens]MTH78032.1 PIN domain-containing protein [Paracoccus aestuariivivens]